MARGGEATSCAALSEAVVPSTLPLFFTFFDCGSDCFYWATAYWLGTVCQLLSVLGLLADSRGFCMVAWLVTLVACVCARSRLPNATTQPPQCYSPGMPKCSEPVTQGATMLAQLRARTASIPN